MPKQPAPDFILVTEAADRLGKSKRTVLRYIALGIIPASAVEWIGHLQRVDANVLNKIDLPKEGWPKGKPRGKRKKKG